MKIFCVGIGGIGLSGVAQIMKSQGHELSGSDAVASDITDSLKRSDIQVQRVHRPENIDDTFDLLIYSEAVPADNPERVRAKELGIKQINYAEALGMLSKKKKTIAITGTHGKTTITGMMTSILLNAGWDPTIIIGSKIDVLNHQNFRVGAGEWFLAEACEYRENFLHLDPHVVLINSLEPDHLDYFGTKDRYHAAYQKFIEKIPADGHLILFARDQQHLDLTKVRGEVHIMEDPDTSRKLYQLRIPGKHNQRNAYAAEQVASVLGVFPEAIKCGLENFNGTWRRFEYKGSVNGAKVYDDYGHHPTEIKATIQGARELYPDQNLVVVFQPHQYSRTAFFLDEFATAFKGASDVWITPIYKVRDSQADVQKVSSEDLVTRINQQQNAELISMEEAAKRINSNSGPSDVYLVMGAGNINGIFSKLFLNL